MSEERSKEVAEAAAAYTVYTTSTNNKYHSKRSKGDFSRSNVELLLSHHVLLCLFNHTPCGHGHGFNFL